MRFRKPWLRVKCVNFDFSTKSSSTDYNESNKPTPKSLALIGAEKLLVEHGSSKNPIFCSTEKFTSHPEPWVVYNYQVLIMTSQIRQTQSP